MARQRFVGKPGGGWVPAEEYVPDPASQMIMPDIKPYRNMVDGREIGSRSEHREFLKRNNLIEIGNEVQSHKPKPITAPGLKQQIIEIAAEKLRYR
jgi:hypothetical protein